MQTLGFFNQIRPLSIKNVVIILLYNHSERDRFSRVTYRSHTKVVCVSQTNLTSKALQLVHSDPLQGPLCSDWHENRSSDVAVRQSQITSPRFGHRTFRNNSQSEGRSRRQRFLHRHAVFCSAWNHYMLHRGGHLSVTMWPEAKTSDTQIDQSETRSLFVAKSRAPLVSESQ